MAESNAARAIDQNGQDVGNDTSQSAPPDSWRDVLPDELKESSSLEKFKSPEDLAKSYLHLEQKLGRAVPIPTEEAGEETWKEFEQRLKDIPGITRVPTDPDGDWSDVLTKLGVPAEPDEYQVDDDALKRFAHENKMTRKQAQAVHEMLKGEHERKVEEDKAKTQEAVDAMKAKYGDRWQSVAGNAKRMAEIIDEKTGGNFVETLVNSGLANEPSIIEGLAGMARMLNEPDAVGGKKNLGFSEDPEVARQKIAEIQANENDPYWKGDKARVAYMARLFRIANGEE